jgi:hypothetical protein
MRSPAANVKPATSQSCVTVRPPPARVSSEELLGGGIQVGVVDQPRSFLGPRVEPIEGAGEQ